MVLARFWWCRRRTSQKKRCPVAGLDAKRRTFRVCLDAVVGQTVASTLSLAAIERRRSLRPDSRRRALWIAAVLRPWARCDLSPDERVDAIWSRWRSGDDSRSRRRGLSVRLSSSSRRRRVIWLPFAPLAVETLSVRLRVCRCVSPAVPQQTIPTSRFCEGSCARRQKR